MPEIRRLFILVYLKCIEKLVAEANDGLASLYGMSRVLHQRSEAANDYFTTAGIWPPMSGACRLLGISCVGHRRRRKCQRSLAALDVLNKVTMMRAHGVLRAT